jgi:hypothetical protein
MNEPSPNLGIFEYEYDTNQNSRYFSLLVGCGLLGIGLIGFALALRGNVLIIWLSMFFLFILFSILGFILVKRFRNNRSGNVKIYAKGLDITIDEKRYVATWKDFEWIKEIITENKANGIWVSNNYQYIIKLKNGDEFVLDNVFSEVQEIGERLSNEIVKLLYPQYLRDIRNGGKVEFDEISMDSAGLSVKDKKHSWSQIERFEIEAGTIEIFAKSGQTIWQKTYSNIQNPRVFVKLLEYFVKESDGK